MEKLAAEVHALAQEVADLRKEINDRNTATKNRTIATVVAMVVLAFASWQSLNASDEAKDAAAQAEATSEAQQVIIDEAEADRAEVALLACQNRNSSQRSIRDAFEQVWLLIEAGSPSPRTQKFIDDARVELAEVKDRDCDGDDVLDEQDYLTERQINEAP